MDSLTAKFLHSLNIIERLKKLVKEINVCVGTGAGERLGEMTLRKLLNPQWQPEETELPEIQWMNRIVYQLESEELFSNIVEDIQGNYELSLVALSHILNSILLHIRDCPIDDHLDIKRDRYKLEIAKKMGFSTSSLLEKIRQAEDQYSKLGQSNITLNLDSAHNLLNCLEEEGTTTNPDGLLAPLGAEGENDRHEALMVINDSRLQTIFKCLGRLEGIVKTPSVSRTLTTFDIDYGADISSIYSEEWMEDEDLFNLRFAEESLMQTGRSQSPTSGNGDFIAMIDFSSSMKGQASRDIEFSSEAIAKAFVLKCAELVRKNNRECYAAAFTQQIFFDHKIGEDCKKTLQLLKKSPYGNENWETALNWAIEHIEKHRKYDSDVLLVTDGYSTVSQAWLDSYREKRKEYQFKVYAIAIGGLCIEGNQFWDEINKVADLVVPVNSWSNVENLSTILEEINH